MPYRLLLWASFWITRVYCLLCRLVSVRQSLPACPVEVMGLTFSNPVGLAAGFDRDGKLAGWLAPAGFGFVEIGTINVDSEAVSDTELARIGRTLRKARTRSGACSNPAHRQLLGISLGSMWETLDERTVADYLRGMEVLWPYADYLAINLSRPGSPGRTLPADPAVLRFLLENIKQGHAALAERYESQVPIVVKAAIERRREKTIPPSVFLARELEFDGVLVAFERWPSRQEVIECISELRASIHPLSLIIVGGIRTADDARQTLDAGADLVQLFSGFVEQGPLRTRRMIARVSELAVRERQEARRITGLTYRARP